MKKILSIVSGNPSGSLNIAIDISNYLKTKGYEVVVGDATGTKDLSDSSKLVKKADPANVKPTEASTVEEIKAYLTAHKIDFSGKTTKNDLLALVK